MSEEQPESGSGSPLKPTTMSSPLEKVEGDMTQDLATHGLVRTTQRTFIGRLRVGLSRGRVLIMALGAIFVGLGTYVASLGLVREELCRDGLRWACSRLSCSQPIFLDLSAGTLRTTISNPTEYSAIILNATLDLDAGLMHHSMPLQAGAEGVTPSKACVAVPSLIPIDLKSKSATSVELVPTHRADCGVLSNLACETSGTNWAIPRECQLTLRIRDALGSEYPLNAKFSCSALIQRNCSKAQADPQQTIFHSTSPPTAKSWVRGLMSPASGQVRKDVSGHFVRGGTAVLEQDIWTQEPRSCGSIADVQECSVLVEVTTTDVSGLHHCGAHLAVYRNVNNTWKFDDLTDAGKCAH